MERNSAACVMEWSIDLEKALRSPKPGRSHEAILEMGPKLVRLSSELECSPVIYRMFDLIPGEDKLFSNVIVLRLASAFESGDKHTRLCILKAFLYEFRKRDKGRHYRGVLSKTEDCVHVEFLQRVKAVFDSGDPEDRALALGLYGCWAHFAKESPSIRYLVLSSIISPHILEVKASLFAAGCFAELSEDFAQVVLEMLPHVMNSLETFPGIRLVGARLVAKLGFSHSIAANAYKTGVKLFLEHSDEEYQVSMLVSISKLASRSTILISEHVDLLVSFLSKEKSFNLRGAALRCLQYIFSKRICCVPLNASLLNTLFSMLEEPQLPSPMLIQVLQSLRKIIIGMHPDIPFAAFESSKLLNFATDVSPSPNTPESMLAISILVDIARKLKGSTQMEYFLQLESPLPSRLIFLIIDRITLMVRPVLALGQMNSFVLQKVNVLLDLLIVLNQEYPDLHLIVLDNIFGLIKLISIEHESVMARTDAGVVVCDNLNLKESLVVRSRLVYRICKYLVAFLEHLREAEVLSTKVFDKVKILVGYLCQSNLFECYAYTIYSLLLVNPFIWGYLVHESVGHSNTLSGIYVCDYSVEHETSVIEFAKRLLTEKNSWPAYRVGKYAACQGAWHTATLVFEQLGSRVHSYLCCHWLKSLVFYSQGELTCELLRLPKQRLKICNFHHITSAEDLGEVGKDAACNIEGNDFTKELAAAYKSIRSSLETLRVNVTTDPIFYFQRWFLSLRAKLLGAVMEIFIILRNPTINRQGENSSLVEYSMPLQKLTQISLNLKRAAREIDLISTSFIDMDKKSATIISALATSCSLLAFGSGFAFYIPSLADSVAVCGRGVSNDIDCILVQNFVGRLSHSKQETITDLCLLLEADGKSHDCFHFPSRIQGSESCFETTNILGVFSYAVSGFSSLKSKSSRSQSEESISEVTKDGLQLLFEILLKWMHIPSRTPKYFFNLRPCLGLELFAGNGTRNPDGICIPLGFHLSLDLCLQLRNVPSDLPVRLKKVFCMLCCKPQFLEPDRGACQPWETDDWVENNENLLKYATECSKRKKGNKRGRSSSVDIEFMNSFMCFELNDRGQGFSSCLLDVSGFTVGSYRIKWYSCCFDNQGKCWTLPSLNSGPVFTVRGL